MDTITPSDLPSPILSLPPEILASIFKVLEVQGKKQVSQVCRSWRDTSMLKEVWCDTMVEIDMNAVIQDAYVFLSCRGVRKIVLQNLIPRNGGIPYPFPMIPPTMRSALSGLTHLVLDHSPVIYDRSILLMSQTFKELISLQLGSNQSYWAFTNASIGYICNGLKKLESLAFMEYPNINDAGIEQLANSDLPLRFLGLHDCRLLTHESFRYLSLGKQSFEGLQQSWCRKFKSASSIKYLATMKQLRYLKFRNIHLSNHHWLLIASMASLRTLSLKMVNGKNFDFGIEALMNGRAPIEKLVLDTWLTDVSLKHMAAMPHLRQLSISKSNLVTQKGLEDLMRGNKQLSSLDIINCQGIQTPESLKCIVANQPNLRRLHLQSESWYPPKPISKDILAMVARQLPYLTYLTVDGTNLIHKLELPKPHN